MWGANNFDSDVLRELVCTTKNDFVLNYDYVAQTAFRK